MNHKLIVLLGILPVFSCYGEKDKAAHPEGVYTTYIPNVIDRVKLEIHFHGRMTATPLVMLYLRKDLTYVWGGCDNQVSETGRYKISHDTIVLYDRYNTVSKTAIAQTGYLVSRKEMLYAFQPSEDKVSNSSYNEIIPLKRNWIKAHYGFLRGQDLPYDSLKTNYEIRSLGEQQQWSDSTKAALLNK